jgi:DNA-binding transcriptional LysR family regulator
MDTLTSIRVFVKVVESGSFVAASERLELSTATVSKHVMNVEKRVGARLLNRNAHAISLTEPGQVYFERCKSILDDWENAERELASFGNAARGTLQITCPSWFATQRLADTFALYQRRYPDVVVDVSFEDRFANIVEEGYDLALRVTSSPDELPAGLIARPVRSVTFYMGASREYLKHRQAPRSPEDLAHHGFVAVGNLKSWVFAGPHGRIEVPARVVARYRSMAGVANAVAAGIGLAPLPAHFFEEPALKGVLTPVLTDYPVWETKLYLVYVSRKHVPPKIRTFIDFFLELVGEESGRTAEGAALWNIIRRYDRGGPKAAAGPTDDRAATEPAAPQLAR